jgi:hypothetical protein
LVADELPGGGAGEQREEALPRKVAEPLVIVPDMWNE